MRIKNNDLNMTVALTSFRNRLIKRTLSPYRKYQKFLDTSQWWSKTQIQDYQIKQIQKMVSRAFKHVFYYKTIMSVYGVRPQDIQSFDDLDRLPILEKEDVRTFHNEMVSNDMIDSTLYKCHTSGTTGKPLTLYRDLDNVGFEYAILQRQKLWAGLKGKSLIATLKGDLIPENSIKNNVYWAFSPFENKLMMSSFHISEKTVDEYITALRRYQPLGIDGYPSSIYILAKFMLKKNIRFPLKAVLTSSETLSPNHKSVIEKAFACPVYDYYGMAERIAAIHTCEHGNYHIVPEYSYIEFGRRPGLTDNSYEIIGTSFSNRAMPLIRYRIGDVVKLSDKTCACGREFPVVESVIGRIDDYIVTPSGKVIGRLGNFFQGSHNYKEAQIYQPDVDNLVVRIVPDKSFTKYDGDAILNQLQRRIGERMHCQLENVSSIPRSSRGKFKAVISKVNAF